MLKHALADIPSERLKEEAGQAEDTTPELSAERRFYQQDINHVCNASPVPPLRPLKGTGSKIGVPYQMLQN